MFEATTDAATPTMINSCEDVSGGNSSNKNKHARIVSSPLLEHNDLSRLVSSATDPIDGSMSPITIPMTEAVPSVVQQVIVVKVMIDRQRDN